MINPILTDRTSEEVDEVCGMKYWWYRLEGGKGIVPTDEADYLTDGKDLHLDLALFAQGRTVEEVLLSIPPSLPTSWVSVPGNAPPDELRGGRRLVCTLSPP